MTSPTEDIVKSISAQFPNMSEREVEIEFLIQVWIAAEEGDVVIIKDDVSKYYFMGTNNELPVGKTILPQEFYDTVLVEIIIEAIEKGFIYVIDDTQQGDYVFMNAHEINMDDFFIHSMPRKDAIQFTKDLVDDTHLV